MLKQLLLATLLFLFPGSLQAQGPDPREPRDAVASHTVRSDQTALAVIFDRQHLLDSALDVHRRARAMAIERRLSFLTQWVLPSQDPVAVRMQVAFTPTHPTSLAGEMGTASGFRIQSGSEIVSPALDLIEAAAGLGKLDELRSRMAEITTHNSEQQIQQLAMLALIDIERNDYANAGRHLEALFAAAFADPIRGETTRDALLLCVHRAAEYPETSKVILDPAYRIVASYFAVYERDPWHRHFTAAYARARENITPGAQKQALSSFVQPSSQWHPVSRLQARYRGSGCPIPQWIIAPGHIENIVSHDEDYLYFNMPLRGNFEVECDVTGFDWRDSHLLTAGKWVAPVYDHQSYDVGNVRGLERRVSFTPPLTKTGDTIHYRTVVRDGVATTWFNGRKIHEEQLPVEHEPWLAIRSSARHDGGVRNLRITGEPYIPRQLALSSSPQLAGWVPYFEESIGHANADWRHQAAVGGQGEIHGRHQSEVPPGCYKESVLFYQRPMLEDGSIEYEFWYQPEAVEAHPALDRLCFLLEPDGVNLHPLTDRKYDGSALGPDTIFTEPENQRGVSPLPLKVNDWNRLRLTLRKDVLSLTLNQELVYERQLEATNQRVFGLFHYADRSALQVRNVTWEGDWPRELPTLEGQELAIDETGFIDQRLPELTAVFSHDFAAEGLPLNRFAILQGDVPAHVSAASDGLHAGRPGTGGYRNATVAPILKIGGDFDITATFDQLATDPRGTGTSSIMLTAVADNSTLDQAMLARRRTLLQGRDEQIAQCLLLRNEGGVERRHYFGRQPLEANSGTLRLARRGDQVYYLFAEADSEQFRIMGQETFTRDDLQVEGVQLMVQIRGEEGATSAVWKTLVVRAEKLHGLAVEGEDQLAQLNAGRSRLAKSFAHDFTRQPPDETVFYRWTDHRRWNSEDQGLLIAAPGTEEWSSAGAALLKRLDGDFDVSIRFDPQHLDTPAENLRSSVYLQIELADEDATQASVILNKHSTTKTEVLAQLRVSDGQGGHHYRRIGGLIAATAEELRLARRGRRLYFIGSSPGFGGEQLIGHIDVSNAPVLAGSTRVMVHTGGHGRESRVVWKSIQVHANQILPEAGIQQPAPSNSPLRSLFDFPFR